MLILDTSNYSMCLVKNPLTLYCEKIQRQGKIRNNTYLSSQSLNKHLQLYRTDEVYQKCQENVVCMDVNQIINRQKCAIVCFPRDETLRRNERISSQLNTLVYVNNTSPLKKSADSM